MENKTVLITGSNKGIGFETARQLEAKGFKVFISGRDESRLNEALNKLKKENPNVVGLLIDVTDLQSIKKAASDFAKFNLKLDVLINNAAILPRNDKSLLLNEQSLTEKVIQVNCFGAINVSREFLPFMNQPGRIINVSSGGGSMTDEVGGWAPAYCVSKTMLNAITRQLAYELKEKAISVNSLCPGWVRTDMGGQGATRPVEKGAETTVWLASEAPLKLTGKFFRDKKEIQW